MCTVTYFPTTKGFVLTHNRDEAPRRSPRHISREQFGRVELTFPRDVKAGGTWIAASSGGRTACLLNGAFAKHPHRPPYRRSRGLILLDSFGYSRAADFAGQYDFEGIEPFTCLLFEAGEVLEFRWDGETGHLAEKDPEQAHFWCSATLYPPEMQALRRKVFENFLTGLDRAPDEKNAPENLFRLHLEGKVGDPENDFVMNRQGRVRTVSITQVIRRGEDFKMRYEDLLKEEDLLD